MSSKTLTPEQLNGRIGGLTFVATHDASAAIAHARAAYAATWLEGHGCRLCGERVEIDPSLPMKERQRRADALRKRHYVLMGKRRHINDR